MLTRQMQQILINGGANTSCETNGSPSYGYGETHGHSQPSKAGRRPGGPTEGDAGKTCTLGPDLEAGGQQVVRMTACVGFGGGREDAFECKSLHLDRLSM